MNSQSLATVRRWPHGYGGALTSVAFSPDNRRLLTTSEDQFVRVWDAATGTHLHDLDGHGNTLFCAVYSPDGKRIASGGRDANVWIWDAETFEPVARLGGHEDYVYSLAWRADSQQLVSGSGDYTVRIWDTQPLALRAQTRHERQTILINVEPIGKAAVRGPLRCKQSSRARKIQPIVDRARTTGRVANRSSNLPRSSEC